MCACARVFGGCGGTRARNSIGPRSAATRGMAIKQPFLTDVTELRKRARQHLESGAITPGYGGDVERAVALLNTALATELVCVLRYRYHAVMATGISSESVKAEFAEHADDEQMHALRIAERINQLGGKPDFDPEGLASRSHSEYVEGETLVDMIRENLIAERIAIESYREMVKYFATHDPTTRKLLEEILEKEEEHANDMHDLLVSHG
jgi:bacterioferritin